MEIREAVQQQYGKIAESMRDKSAPKTSCGPTSCGPTSCGPTSCGPTSCGPTSCGSTSYGCGGNITDTSINYKGMELSSLPKEAIEASLGCANPFVFAELKEGETVLDLGSGGGIDVLMASRLVGDSGKVYGLDMTDEMLLLANENKEKMGVVNVEFIKGYIEEIPLANDSVDVVLSNCVINLSEDKKKALAEAYRVIKQGGRLRVADIVTIKEVAPELRKNAEMWSGCLAGTITISEYEQLLQECGFTNIKIDIAHTYTKEIIKSEFMSSLENDLPNVNLDALDGAFAGALIRADK